MTPRAPPRQLGLSQFLDVQEDRERDDVGAGDADDDEDGSGDGTDE